MPSGACKQRPFFVKSAKLSAPQSKLPLSAHSSPSTWRWSAAWQSFGLPHWLYLEKTAIADIHNRPLLSSVYKAWKFLTTAYLQLVAVSSTASLSHASLEECINVSMMQRRSVFRYQLELSSQLDTLSIDESENIRCHAASSLAATVEGIPRISEQLQDRIRMYVTCPSIWLLWNAYNQSVHICLLFLPSLQTSPDPLSSARNFLELSLYLADSVTHSSILTCFQRPFTGLLTSCLGRA